ncbi:MAG: type II toxin-antitoxin system HicB family antitoxin [Actinomycetota bacterium]|nr:type II toxin-antitoxin system HicB family antitoxin [Actinomycetota bacterium]
MDAILTKRYLVAPYAVKIVPIPEKEGGGYSACVPELGEPYCVADGNTPEEAVANLFNFCIEELKRLKVQGDKTR